MTEKFFQFEKWYAKNLAHRPAGERIIWLESEIDKIEEFWTKKCIFLNLYTSNLEIAQFERALDVKEREIQFDPNDALAFITKAELLLYLMDKPEEALETIERGISLSVETKRFRRHALAVKARIALRLENYTLLDEVLVSISELKLEKGAEDVGREADFFDKADKSKLSSEVVSKYEAYLAEKR